MTPELKKLIALEDAARNKRSGKMTLVNAFEIGKPEKLYSVAVLDYPQIGRKLELKDGLRAISIKPSILIEFDYPLNNPVTIEFFRHDKAAFTLCDLFRCVYNGYKQIYAAEPEPSEQERAASNLYNRPTTHDPYGIWGHDLGDLFFEGYEETEPGKFVLHIGS
jgi:hypothetical protein